ncbi:hypothetical protein CBS147347_11505 [Aspergillus niger]|nr:hypothetical protein CBS147347_11505 [Aspergillus niger]
MAEKNRIHRDRINARILNAKCKPLLYSRAQRAEKDETAATGKYPTQGHNSRGQSNADRARVQSLRLHLLFAGQCSPVQPVVLVAQSSRLRGQTRRSKMAKSTTRRARRRWQKRELQRLRPWMEEQERQGTTWKVREQNWLRDIGTRRSGPAIQAQWHRHTRKRPLTGHAEDDGNARVRTIPAEPSRVAATQQEAAGPASPATSSSCSPPPSETVRPSSCPDPVPSRSDEIPPPIEARFWSLLQFS